MYAQRNICRNFIYTLVSLNPEIFIQKYIIFVWWNMHASVDFKLISYHSSVRDLSEYMNMTSFKSNGPKKNALKVMYFRQLQSNNLFPPLYQLRIFFKNLISARECIAYTHSERA